MVAVSTVVPPACGLFRTTRPLSEDVRGGMLVNLHTHAEPAVVYLPRCNTHNRWGWSKTPRPIRERGLLESLRALPAEGHYLLPARLEFPGGAWPARSLVQVGYDIAGNGLLFLAQRKFQRAENTLVFAERGLWVKDVVLFALEAVVVFEEPEPDDHAP